MEKPDAPLNPLVLHVRGVTGHGGGPEKTIINSPRFLESMGYNAVCAYMHPPADPGYAELEARALQANTSLLSVPDRGPLDWRVATQLMKYCRSARIAVWHGHDYKSNALGLLVRRVHRMKLATTVHGWVRHTKRTPLYYGIDRYCLRHYDRVICVSQDLYDQCLEVGVKQDRCVLIENAIDVDDFQRNTTDPQPTAQESTTLRIGAMGRLSPEKGFDLLIKAVDQLIQDGVMCELKIAGTGDSQDDLNHLIQQLGRQNEIQLVGLSDPKTFQESIDLFVLSSLREGLPNVVLEAMAMETPVVVTRIAGLPKLIADRQNGLLVEPNSVEALIEGIRTLAEAPDLRSRLASAARRTIEQRYSFQHRMEKMAAIYDDLLAGAESRQAERRSAEKS